MDSDIMTIREAGEYLGVTCQTPSGAEIRAFQGDAR